MKSKSEKKLFQIADSQLGYFTTKQAMKAGYIPKNYSYHVKRGHWIRESRGIFRLANYPRSSDSELVMFSLWSRNRTDVVEGVYSHETALSIYEVSDAMPSKLHMTVPKSFRKSASVPAVIVLHKSNLSKSEISQKKGYAITTPIRTIKDLISEPSTDQDVLTQAIHDFRNKGLITENQLIELVEKHPSLARQVLNVLSNRKTS